MMAEANAEVIKLQTHLKLLREQYVKLQSQLSELEKKYEIATAEGSDGQENFASRLLRIVADLFDKDTYSDLQVMLADGGVVQAHRFVLAARSDSWGKDDIMQMESLNLTDIDHEVARGLIRWVYTDHIDLRRDDQFILDVMKAASNFKLVSLVYKCEMALVSFVSVTNCIRFYEIADAIHAETLRDHCSELISNHWNDFSYEDFCHISAPLLYTMFKQKTKYPLHTAIRTHREDVVFLYLIEFDSQLPTLLDELDDNGELALDIALRDRLDGIAETLVTHKANTNCADSLGRCLLHKAMERGDDYAATFLIKAGCDVRAATRTDLLTPLHIAAAAKDTHQEGMARITTLLLQTGADANAQDSGGRTPLASAVIHANSLVFDQLLQHCGTDIDLVDNEGSSPLWAALRNDNDFMHQDSFANRLVQKKASLDARMKESQDTMLHRAARDCAEQAAIFLVSCGASVNEINAKGETPLHIACYRGLDSLVEALLLQHANPNVKLAFAESDSEDEDRIEQTAMHLAIRFQHEKCITTLLKHKGFVTTSRDDKYTVPDFNIKDSRDQTPFGLALWNGFHDVAMQLLQGGSNVDDSNSDGMSLLHQAIMKQDTASAIFLLEHGANRTKRTAEGETPLHLAIKRHLPVVVDALCSRGADMNLTNVDGDCPLWQALETGQEDIGHILVKHGCDRDVWGPGPDGCLQTLLHRAIDESNEAVGVFLIKNGCDVNCPRRSATPGGESDGQGPLHLACSWGLETLAKCLIEHNADVNRQDSLGNTAIHIAIENQYPELTSLLINHPLLDLTLRNKQGMTPFAMAMTVKNNQAAQSILVKEPSAAEQVDTKGRNFLHTAIMKSDIESVLFLISVQANVNSRVQDAYAFTPLHLAVRAGTEIIVRNLILAGAQVNAKAGMKQTPLHIASEHDLANIVTILLENGIQFDAVDDNQNNALHIAVQHGNLNTVRVLLTESSIDAEAVNVKGQNPLHVLGQYGKENAAAIFELFKESMPEYPLGALDNDGNSVLLLSYMNGIAHLCRSIVRAGSALGTVNKQGFSIFNFPVPTKQLLFKLLDILAQEPQWSEGESCLECSVKFGIKTRKHHCRHCGRLLCAKCSDKDVPILKYNLTKPVRVCNVCFDVLTLGVL